MEFLKEKMYVTALDISEKMLEFAKINMSSISDNYDIIHSEWSNISSAQLTKGGKYDLVFASNSPGIRSYDDIKKICEISRKYCFINKFAHRTDHLKEAFSNCIGLKNSEKEKSYLGVLEHIKNLGYKPVYEFANQWWADKVSVETAVENYVDFQKLNGILISDNDKKILTEYAHSIKDENGLLEEKTTAEAIWIKWEV